jgi:multiple sugar transport system ATP-binding protein
VGAPLEVYDRPANVFVAGFIGSPAMNLLPATVAGGGEVEVGGTRLAAPEVAGLAPGTAVTYGVRPEHLDLADTGLAARVAVVEPTGSETHLVLHMEGRDLVAVLRDRLAIRPGDTVRLAPRAGLHHVFDATSGVRIG